MISVESLDAFQNLDICRDWESHEPHFEWLAEELEEFAREKEYQDQVQESLAAWWDFEGVRCATFGRDPQENPYR